MNRGDWRSVVHRGAKSWTRLKYDLAHTYTHTRTHTHTQRHSS